jgi:hypothetical protein
MPITFNGLKPLVVRGNFDEDVQKKPNRGSRRLHVCGISAKPQSEDCGYHHIELFVQPSIHVLLFDDSEFLHYEVMLM